MRLTPSSAPTAVALLDDHPVVRAGFQTILAPEPDLVAAGTAATEDELWTLLHATRPDVVVLDRHHPGADGLAIALRVERELPGTRVILYAAALDADVLVAATVAGVDGVVDKASSPSDLLDAIRAVARGERTLPPIPVRLRRRAAAKLDPLDHAIFAMRLAGTAQREIGETLGLRLAELATRTAAIVRRLLVPQGALAPVERMA